jgi:uncharacterized protein YodC (DUF2158 family)
MIGLRVGDVVTLNSGGPKMTVLEVQDEEVHVAWVNDDAELELSWFPRVCVHLLRGRQD